MAFSRADAYDRFMGRFSQPLAIEFARLAGVRRGQRALDVGCGPGALTRVLVDLLGADQVAAVDPSPPFVAAARERLPRVDVREASAEELPFPDAAYDAALAQLVVHFMSDPVQGLREMARVTRPGGTVAACVWDHAGGAGPLSVFWQAVHDTDPDARDEGDLPGTRAGDLERLLRQAGMTDVTVSLVSVRVSFATVEEWWEPYTLGVGPAGDYVASLGPAGVARLRARCAQLLPPEPFEVSAAAHCAVAVTG